MNDSSSPLWRLHVWFGHPAFAVGKVGEVLDALRERGYFDNAVVIFTSDHGDCLTDHGHSQKWTMYEAITRMPTVVWAPQRFAGGRQIDGL